MTDGVIGVRYVHVVPADHGVCAFGLDLQRAVEATGSCAVQDHWIKPGGTLPSMSSQNITHLQFTDNLWGGDAASAAHSMCQTLRSATGPVVVTLHDLPDPADDPGRWRRRAPVYQQVARLADRVVVCSHHERRRLRLVAPDIGADVVPNPLPPQPQVTGSTRLGQGMVGVLGWVFPDKGHADVIRAVANLPAPRRVVILGAVAQGHTTYAAQLKDLACRLQVPLSLTGWLAPTAQRHLMGVVDVAVAPHRNPSASGSMLAWIAAGRRPLIRRSAYAEELALRAPMAVTMYDPSRLSTAIHRELTDPARTIGVPPELALETAARRHLKIYTAVGQTVAVRDQRQLQRVPVAP
ncbi:hypothetical protein BH24ACT15_BH24ACT15_23910 [soil metagenome]